MHMNFVQEAKYGLFSAILNGTGIWKYGWTEKYETYYEFEPVGEPLKDDDGNEIPTAESDMFYKIPKERLVARPFFMNCDIRHVLVDPGCRTPDIRDAKFVIHEFAVTYQTIDAVEGRGLLRRDDRKADLPLQPPFRGRDPLVVRAPEGYGLGSFRNAEQHEYDQRSVGSARGSYVRKNDTGSPGRTSANSRALGQR